MGTPLIKKQLTCITILKYAEEINKLEKTKPDSYIQEIVSLLLSFTNSDDFIPFMLINKENILFNIFIMCELGKEKDKYLFIKILFPLLEELKKSNFDSKISEVQQIKEDDKKNKLSSYYNQNQELINEKLNNDTGKGKKPFDALKSMIKSKSEIYGNYLSRIINVLFADEEIVKKNSKTQNIIDEAFNFFKPYFYDLKASKDYDIYKLIEYLIELYPSLEIIAEIYNITMFAILKTINEDKMKSKFSIYEKQIDFLAYIMNSKDNFTWFLIEDNKKKPKKVSGKIRVKEEQVIINVFEIINNKSKDKILNGYIYKSIFTKYDIIMIKIDLQYYKANKTNLEIIKDDLEKEIKRIKESNKEYQNLNTYINIDNTTILYPQSYDLFLQNLLRKDIISINQVPEEYHNIIELFLIKNETLAIPKKNEDMNEVINNKEDVNNSITKIEINKLINQFTYNKRESNEKNDNNKIFNCKTFVDDNNNENQFIGNNQKILDIQNDENYCLQINQLKEELEKEKLKNKELSETIKKLENNIIKENHKNKNLELRINELNDEIDLLKKTNDKLKNLQETAGQFSKDRSEIKNSIYESIFEKEKEIKELKSKLSRYPLLLNDGEKIMSLIFTSADQVIHHSVICKNTELFSNVENRLYDEGFSEYKEYENFFTFNGLKINKNKTLEENNIKNSDVIILNVIDDDD